ncbi:LLM class flavin-dependent oxidoreductase [Microlunatus soli]|uniref:Luciferase family oxidoreductase, group 1 n=1 Tax=Microlunatus soli TaxID=630515 RepID=A0A1H1PJR7_9ACTN|nr:LLM class flavin-dependent oxidoreductase [Microlunatus soli]SDS11343.1 luciferase family oxidoreductase, group 1 [Microlunatus soli]
MTKDVNPDRRVPLSVLDLIPVTSGQHVGEAVGNAVDLARRTEEFGYRRFWIAEHHLNPGVAGSAPAVAIALIAANTSSIRVGSGAVLAGNYSALGIVEQFGLIDALYPGRIDLGLGRSAHRAPGPPPKTDDQAPADDQLNTDDHEPVPTAENGLLLPKGPKGLLGRIGRSPRFIAQAKLLGSLEVGQEYTDQVGDLLSLVAGEYADDDGVALHAVPGEGAGFEVWVLGSSGGESAHLAGTRGLPFAANYHVAPERVLEAVDAYRSAFKPSERLAEPYVAISADVVVAEDDESARRLAAGYAPWVRSIRSGQGAIRFPSPEEADRLEWSDADRALVADRTLTQFVGSAETVTARLEQLAEATGADELIITTITHRHADRVQSYRLLAEHWTKSSPTPTAPEGDPR